MIKESYCSYEVSKLLEEKGFNEKTFTYYEDELLCNGNWFEWNNSPLGHIAAPTHQMACAWLREKFGFHIYTFYENEFHWHYVIDSLTKKWRYSVSENKSNDEAIEKALKYSLVNLI